MRNLVIVKLKSVSPSGYGRYMAADTEPLPPLRAVAADEDLFTIVRDWTRDSIQPVRAPEGWANFCATVMVKTPDPWGSVVAFCVVAHREIRPLLVLKNAVALWAVHRNLPDGPVSPADWIWFRRLCLLHNPGLDGALTVIGRAVP